MFSFDFDDYSSIVYYKSKAKFDSESYVMKQEFYSSKDGTKIPIFIAQDKNIVLDGNRPTLMYGYGGFNISQKPYFN